MYKTSSSMCLGNNLVDVARKFQAVVNVDTKIFDSSLLRNNVTSQELKMATHAVEKFELSVTIH